MRRHVRETLGEVADRVRWEGDPRRVVATSKTFKQLARLAGAPPQRKGPFVRRVLTRRDVHAWIRRLARLTVEQRSRLRGVSAPRARQILAGAIVADLTMTTLDIDSVEVCPWAQGGHHAETPGVHGLHAALLTAPLHRPADEPTATVTQLIPAPADMPVDIRHAQPIEQVHNDGDPRQLPATAHPLPDRLPHPASRRPWTAVRLCMTGRIGSRGDRPSGCPRLVTASPQHGADKAGTGRLRRTGSSTRKFDPLPTARTRAISESKSQHCSTAAAPRS
jgi:hypothetical protein